MQQHSASRSQLFRSTRVTALVLVFLLASGCGEVPPHLEPQVATPIGRPGTCSHCDKQIGTVRDRNLVTIDGIQYVVCDEHCAIELKKWLAKQ